MRQLMRPRCGVAVVALSSEWCKKYRLHCGTANDVSHELQSFQKEKRIVLQGHLIKAHGSRTTPFTDFE
jgi:hypothetical protein